MYPLLEEFYEYYQKKPEDPAKMILFGVLKNLFGRRGFDDGWDASNKDTKEEILRTNLEIVKKLMPQ